MEHQGIVNGEGKFIPENLQSFKQDFADRANRNITVSIAYSGENATEKQKNFYFQIVNILTREIQKSNENWQDKQTHLLLTGLFLADTVILGEFVVPTVKSISTLNAEEMKTYLENVKEFMNKKFKLIVE